MSCKVAESLMMRHFDGDLNDIESARLKQHLKVCPECSREFNELSEVLSQVESCEIEPPVGFETEIMNRVSSFEAIRKKRARMFVVSMCGLWMFIIFFLTLSAAAYLDEISFYDMIGLSGKVMGSFSCLIVLAINGIGFIYNSLNRFVDIFLKSAVYMTYNYYYVFVVLMIMLFVLQKILSTMVGGKNGGYR